MKNYTYAWQKMSGAIDALIRPEPMRVRLKNACAWINDYNLKPEVHFPEDMRADFIHLRKEICKKISLEKISLGSALDL
jgi:hypothetical protein